MLPKARLGDEETPARCVSSTHGVGLHTEGSHCLYIGYTKLEGVESSSSPLEGDGLLNNVCRTMRPCVTASAVTADRIVAKSKMAR